MWGRYVKAITSLRGSVVESSLRRESIVVSEILFKFEDTLLVWLELASPVVGTLSIQAQELYIYLHFHPSLCDY